MRLIAAWSEAQNIDDDFPSLLHWEDGSIATMNDFGKIIASTQYCIGYYENMIEYSFETKEHDYGI